MEIISWVAVAIMILLPLLSFIKKFPVSNAIVISNIIVFLLTFYHIPLKDLAFRPSYLLTSKIYTIFTSMFLHGDFYHIFFNMLGLIFIGFPLEQEIGAKKFALVYFISGFFAAIIFSLVNGGNSYLIGASGAIFGILGAFAAAYPFKRIAVPLFMPIILFLRLPVIVVALLYAGIETLYTFSGVTDGIAHSAHVGGFIAGVFLSPLIKVKIEPHERKFSMDDFEPFIENERQRRILERAREADEKEVRDAWLSYLLKDLKCPKCGGGIEIKNGVHCKRCGYGK